MRYGVIGACGYWGANWVRVLSHLDMLYAVCDTDVSKLKIIDAKFLEENQQIKIFDSIDQMLKINLDGVFIVTPPQTHADIAIKAIKNNFNVFIEKPLAVNLEESYKIFDYSKKTDVIIMLGHTFLYHNAIRKFKELLPELGKLRTLYTVRANYGRYQQQGILSDLLPHDLSIFSFITGSDKPTAIKSNLNSHNDMAYVSLTFNDVECSSFLSWSYPEKTRKLIGIGNKGILEWDLGWEHIAFHKKWIEENNNIFLHRDDGTIKFKLSNDSEPLINEALHFTKCIKKHKKPLTSIEEGIKVMEMLELCR